jgi:hypothetical protein
MGEIPNPLLEPSESLGRDPPLPPIVRETKAQKLSLIWSRHRALRLVDLQPKLLGQEPADTRHHPFAGTMALHIDVAVITIATKSVTTSGQFLVEFVEHDVT